ncbi:four-helix bundle copper-binding protein [Aestuariivirga sp.]|uniref:four-helix bundle copper-binding protein n=1 Tax=Aestuariivirga sp. TaxID=2650926 RepID=UPI00391A62B9
MDARTLKMQDCIDDCLRCYATCFGMAMTHCLEAGGEHVAAPHFRIMIACAEICRTAAHFMLMRSAHAGHVCRECAEICEQCAADCEKLGDMDDCVAQCLRCARSCRAMADQPSA